MKTKTRKKGTILMLIGLLLLAAALCLTLYNIYDAKRAEQASVVVIPKLREIIEFEGETLSYPDDGDSQILMSPDREMPSIEIDGERYIGILEIPSVNLTLPIMGKWSYNRLRTAPCLYKGSVYQNNMVIAGHNYARHFRPIKNLPVGTKLYFTDGENRRFEYEIGWIEVLDGTQVEEMISGDWDLTLFTCTYGGEARYAARCLKKE